MKPRLPTGTDRFWDAGEAGCGRLIMGLKQEVDLLPPGGRLRVIARDPAACIDLDYWCHMTGHELVSAKPPHFVLKKKGR